MSPSDPSFGTNPLCVSSSMMEESPRYGEWMADVIRSHLRGHVLEVGCGNGHYTAHYAALPGVERITAVDLKPDAIDAARRRHAQEGVEFRCEDARELAPGAFDSIVCANVIEHIEDHEGFLGSLAAALRPGGSLAILVPAHPALYGSADSEAGHHRRYSRRALRAAIAPSGLEVERLFCFNLLGALGWVYAFKLRQRRAVSESQSRPMIRIFERYFLPVGRFAERRLPVPFGLSLIALCRRSSAPA